MVTPVIGFSTSKMSLMKDATTIFLNDDSDEDGSDEPILVKQRNCFWDNIDDNESITSMI